MKKSRLLRKDLNRLCRELEAEKKFVSRRLGEVQMMHERAVTALKKERDEQSNARAGNGVVMRDALESVRRDMWDLMGSSSESLRESLACKISATIRAALATPARNCDVMSLESAKKLWFAKEIMPRLNGDLPLGKEIPFEEWFVSLTIKVGEK